MYDGTELFYGPEMNLEMKSLSQCFSTLCCTIKYKLSPCGVSWTRSVCSYSSRYSTIVLNISGVMSFKYAILLSLEVNRNDALLGLCCQKKNETVHCLSAEANPLSDMYGNLFGTVFSFGTAFSASSYTIQICDFNTAILHFCT